MPAIPDRHPLYYRINDGLMVLASYDPEPPGWYQALVVLGPHPSDEDRLAVYRSMFHGDDVLKTIGFFLVARHVQIMATMEESAELDRLGDQIDAIREAHGLAEDEDWLLEEAPAEYQRLDREFEDLTYELYARKLEEVGEDTMAFLLRWDRKRFEGFWDCGRRLLIVPRATGGPEVDEVRLRAVVRNEMPKAEAREVHRLILTFAAWDAAYDRLLAEEDRQSRRIRRRSAEQPP